MAYFSPYIDNTGMHVPTYEDIRDNLIDSMKTIFGQDIYIDEDTQDYQQISIFAKKIYDVNSLAVLVYNNRTANTAIGVGLDNLCALVGIERKPATYSIVQLTVTGDPGTVITSGQASDGANTWDLPNEVEIPSNGTITVTSKCHKAGNISAPAGTITTIITPTYGWTSVTNTYAATPGDNVETDAELRARYYLSTLAPSHSIFESLLASLTAVEGVEKVKGYENDTSEVSAEGFPAHSVTFVVQGGDEQPIAANIYYKKTPGCYTNGTTEVDFVSNTGDSTVIRFYRPTVKNVWVKISLKKLAPYNNIYASEIQNAMTEYINGLGIAETLYNSVLWGVAVSQMDAISTPAYSVLSVQTSTNGTTYSDADITLNFNEVFATEEAKIIVEVS